MIDFVFRLLFDFEFFFKYLPELLSLVGVILFVAFIVWLVTD